jgi:hypothetical protein
MLRFPFQAGVRGYGEYLRDAVRATTEFGWRAWRTIAALARRRAFARVNCA